ncbi:MAG TPA: hypothetical protein VEV38_00355 [Candidatus Eremiobacteraceae bacterium]|nr:hypothetical protein [Candidatus Eremiobacteraceae bacterium]
MAATSTSAAPFGGSVRTLRYVGDFIASSASEGSDGELYVTYYWDMGGTYYEADRLGALTGSGLREIFAGVFLDELTIIGTSGGYPEFLVGPGDTSHMTPNIGVWSTSGAGVQLTTTLSLSDASNKARPCTWCGEQPAPSVKPYCAPFAGGQLCGSNPGMTFTKNGKTVEVDRDAYLVGAGLHRFLIVERPRFEPPIYIEGFAASD